MDWLIIYTRKSEHLANKVDLSWVGRQELPLRAICTNHQIVTKRFFVFPTMGINWSPTLASSSQQFYQKCLNHFLHAIFRNNGTPYQ